MFELTDLDAAKQQTWDVILVGSSFASMFFICVLPKNLRVLIIEKGQFQSHADLIKNGISGKKDFSQDNTSGRKLPPISDR